MMFFGIRFCVMWKVAKERDDESGCGVAVRSEYVCYLSSLLPILMSHAGPCRGSGEEPGSHGLHQCWQPASPHPGVLGGMEYGKSGGDCSLRHFQVSTISLFFVVVGVSPRHSESSLTAAILYHLVMFV